ncbi:unnamed protein product [Penicillium pancosmium]
MDQARSQPIAENSIGNDLSGFHAIFTRICKVAVLPPLDQAVDRLKREDTQYLTFSLLSALQFSIAPRLLHSRSGEIIRNTNTLLRLISAVASEDFDIRRIKPLLKAYATDSPSEEHIWNLVDVAAVESTPPPRTIASSLQQTLSLHKTSSFANSSEYR